MAVCPFAKNLLIRPGSNDPRINPRVAALHVDAGNSISLFRYFKYRSGGIESHFHIKKNGDIEQYRDTNWEADANYRANPFAISIETQGFGGGTWTEAQLKSIKRLLLWINEVHPEVALRKCDGPYGSGVGYHVQWGAPGAWTPVAKSCPGPNRIKQYNNIIVPWLNSGPDQEEDPLSKYSEKDLMDMMQEAVRRELDRAVEVTKGGKVKRRSMRQMLRELFQRS